MRCTDLSPCSTCLNRWGGMGIESVVGLLCTIQYVFDMHAGACDGTRRALLDSCVPLITAQYRLVPPYSGSNLVAIVMLSCLMSNGMSKEGWVGR